MEVELPFVNNSKCRTAYEDTPDAVIDTRVICAGFLEGKQDSCRVLNASNFNNIYRKCTYQINHFILLFIFNDFRAIPEVR